MSLMLRTQCDSDIIDYNMLLSCLKGYKAPHRTITYLLKTGSLLRVKKGLYVFGEEYRQAAIHRGLLANLIYGPSYVSLEYALAFHGMIPERVEMVTCVTTKRHKLFNTPIGNFSYSYLNQARYRLGIEWYALDNNQHFLLASREKALVDTIATYKDINTIRDMQQHLIENLRIDEQSLRELDLDYLEKINQAYNKKIIDVLTKALRRGI